MAPNLQLFLIVPGAAVAASSSSISSQVGAGAANAAATSALALKDTVRPNRSRAAVNLYCYGLSFNAMAHLLGTTAQSVLR
jgi:hypothetical protein